MLCTVSCNQRMGGHLWLDMMSVLYETSKESGYGVSVFRARLFFIIAGV